ncbi:hypothetical protein CONCODRAFT_11798 [Conidiobolus coronatus NRRL 28638]|uniref:RNI-like protein n=1 Tax=Conidiobolus coronatus (strain ATCC 28846 / CBS 209.66 / NRRL 28638) TaxID=796925 RepID=A0A137NUA2_CONC2|nr:hypothetical protein CONCODRAFT_11798 [Conidiobolus coronatus NRRL 28638]|eukprot:KXN66383.1 hypothetical protein CONCODRAFT_11798 [Conidiobolus coronatus NRRL 28638]
MESGFGNDDYSDINFKFSQPTKIKKLKINLSRLSNISYNSILINCPDLEELNLNGYTFSDPPAIFKFLNISNFNNLKKLDIDCRILCEGTFDTLLSYLPCLNELKIVLNVGWKEVIKPIYEKCASLQRLEIYPPGIIYLRQRDAFLQEFYESEFFTSSPKCKFTLTHLTLNGFRAVDSKAEYFENFKSLKSIKYPPQTLFGYDRNSKEIKIDMNLWPGYRLLKNNYLAGYGAEFKRFKLIN